MIGESWAGCSLASKAVAATQAPAHISTLAGSAMEPCLPLHLAYLPARLATGCLLVVTSSIPHPCRISADTIGLNTPAVALVSTLASVTPAPPFVFRTYQLPPGSEALADQLGAHGGSCKHPVWQAVRASSAASFYLEDFRCGHDMLGMGGMGRCARLPGYHAECPFAPRSAPPCWQPTLSPHFPLPAAAAATSSRMAPSRQTTRLSLRCRRRACCGQTTR